MSKTILKNRSVSTAPLLRVSRDEEVAIETQRDAPSRVNFKNGNNNDTVPSQKVSRGSSTPSRKRSDTSRPGLGHRHSTLAANLDKRRGSSVSRSHFLRSFGQTDLRFHNIEGDEEEILHQTSADIILNTEQNGEASKQRESICSPASKPRAVSAGPVLHVRSFKSQAEDMCFKDILDIRGTEYTGNAADIDIKARLRKQSAKRRIRRITEADEERERQEEKKEKDLEKEKSKKRFTFRGATLAVMMLKGPGIDNIQEKKKLLAAKRNASKRIVSRVTKSHLST